MADAEGKKFYRSAAWQAIRLMVLNAEPLCRLCSQAAMAVDHIIERRERPDLQLDISNLRPLCERCHNIKTAKKQWELRQLVGKDTRCRGSI
jgi:5-methylcytosine-specific restriction protein A